MPSELCKDCLEMRKIEFQIAKTNLDIREVCLTRDHKDEEHEAMIQNITTRMDTMSQDFTDFKAEVKQDIQSIKTEIPAMFDSAVNKLLARILKWALGIIALTFLIGILTTVLAFNRTNLLKGLQELQHKIEQVEIKSK
jgi:membrane protein insertase Oxa1/YidC/SpoIIIJ